MMMTVMFASQNETKHRAAERREAKNSKKGDLSRFWAERSRF